MRLLDRRQKQINCHIRPKHIEMNPRLHTQMINANELKCIFFHFVRFTPENHGLGRNSG
jgi:hypothetical protein